MKKMLVTDESAHLVRDGVHVTSMQSCRDILTFTFVTSEKRWVFNSLFTNN